MADSQLRAGEIKSVLLAEIESFEEALHAEEVGEVLEVKDGVARIYGLTKAMANEMLEITSGESGESVTALALNLEEDNIGAVILGEWAGLHEGDEVRRTGRVLDVPVGDGYQGRVVDSLGAPLDGARARSRPRARRQIDVVAPGIVKRQPVKEPLQTGIKAIDAMIPIGRGQRELIIGDRQTGKTAVAVDAIINQADTDVICIYCASRAAGREGRRRGRDAAATTGRWTTPSSWRPTRPTRRPCSTSRPTPPARWRSTSCGRGGDTLVIYDDLSKQAQAYRQLSLVLRRPPGREAYPGDVFYLHSRLLERAAKLSDEHRRRLAHGAAHHRDAGRRRFGLHPHQRHLDHRRADLSGAGPVQLGCPARRERGHLGVARRADAAQIKAMKKVAGRLRLDLAQYRDTGGLRPVRRPISTRPPSSSWRGESARWRCSSSPSTSPCRSRSRSPSSTPSRTGSSMRHRGGRGAASGSGASTNSSRAASGTDVLIGLRQERRAHRGHRRPARGPAIQAGIRRSTWPTANAAGDGGARVSVPGGPRRPQRRIRSVRNTRQITRTMELVATSKLKRATDRDAGGAALRRGTRATS